MARTTMPTLHRKSTICIEKIQYAWKVYVLDFWELEKIHKGVCRGKIGRIDFLIDPLMDCSLDLPLFYDERNYLIWRLLYVGREWSNHSLFPTERPQHYCYGALFLSNRHAADVFYVNEYFVFSLFVSHRVHLI